VSASAHAKLAPSGADTWMTCPGSVEAQEGLPDDTSEWSAEGSIAHDVSDFCLSYDMDAYDFIGVRTEIVGTEEVRNQYGLILGHRQRVFGLRWTEEDANFLQPGLDWVRQQGGDFYGEHRVDISKWLGEGQFGTLDRGIIRADEKRFIINDLKWGIGIPVRVFGTKQLRLYALGFWWNVARYFEDMESVTLVIDQPRSWMEGGHWTISMDDLLAFGEEIRPAAERALKRDAKRIPSVAGCFWCKRRKAPGGCYAYDEWMLAMLGITRAELLDIEEFLLNKTFTPEERAQLVLHSSLIKSWLEKVGDDTMQDALTLGETGGVKAIEGRKLPDSWIDKDKADTVLAGALGDARFAPQKLITPQQAMKQVSPEDLDDVDTLINHGIRKPTLVPIDHPKPSIPAMKEALNEMEDF
jgi:hypothetical protein